MPFDRDETVAAFKDYYDFLVSMYLPDDIYENAPLDGWPDISIERYASLGKTDAVIDLLRHLPYPDTTRGDLNGPAVGEQTYFQDYRDSRRGIRRILDPPVDPCHFEGTLAPVEPQQVVLTTGDRNSTFLLLDTDWGGMAESIMYNETDSSASARDMFEGYKEKFRSLKWVPISEQTVEAEPAQYSVGRKKMFNDIKQCYRDHGWPTQAFDKHKCREARKEIVRSSSDPDVRSSLRVYFAEVDGE